MPVTDEDEYDGPISMAATQSTTSKAEQRKSNKPIMEKRRRARINHCLNELKTLILNAMKKDPARHSKLEKADILEMTVKHLQTVQRQQLAAAVANDPGVITKFRNGFDECAAEVSRYVSRLDGVDAAVKQRLSAHLHRCVASLQQMAPQQTQQSSHDDNNNSSNGQRALVIPSRLPTGELALVLPNYSSIVSAAPSSAFTAIKPVTDNQNRGFQPFHVEIPNSHLKAHITIPEQTERSSPIAKSPNVIDQSYQVQISPRHVVSSSDGFEPSANAVVSVPIHENLRIQTNEYDKRMDGFQRIPLHAIRQRSQENVSERLPPPVQVHQKPNPNYTLNPKVQNLQQKYYRYNEPPRLRVVDFSEPPAKSPRYSPNIHSSENRLSVIVTEGTRQQNVSHEVRMGIQANQEVNQSNQRDMWRPW